MVAEPVTAAMQGGQMQPEQGSQLFAIGIAAAGTASLLAMATYRGYLGNCAYDVVLRARAFLGGKRTGHKYLGGNFAPVHEEVRGESVAVEQGAIPKELEGVYLRNGPNPFFEPRFDYHWFDGDGMLHAVRLKGGKATYSSHQIETSRLKQERKYGWAVFTKLGDLKGLYGLVLVMLSGLRRALGILDHSDGNSTANTALTFHARRLLALNEGDLPYSMRVLCDGVLETLGRLRVGPSLDGSVTWKGDSFTAHPKLDPRTGELSFFQYKLEAAPFVRAGLLDASGQLARSWDVDVAYGTMMHDMAATANYIVLLHLPLCFDGKAMVERNALPLVFKPELPARIGLLRKDSPSTNARNKFAAVQWFELPAFFAFHVANAYEDEQGRVHISACHFESFDFAAMEEDDMLDRQMQSVYEYHLDPSTGQASMRCVSKVNGDFPVVHPGLACHKARYTYIATMGRSKDEPIYFNGIGKVDLLSPEGKDGLVGTISLPADCMGGEASFVPRHQNPKPNQEDEGWLLVYVFHKSLGTSKLHIFDAKTMASKPVAVIDLKRRVPYGFHGMFLNEYQLAEQHGWAGSIPPPLKSMPKSNSSSPMPSPRNA